MIELSDTICAPATSVGGAAISVIRISGSESLSCVDAVVKFKKGKAVNSKGYVIKYGEIPGVDEVIAGIYRSPHSYTGEDAVELSCHGSEYIVGRILELLCEAGCRLAEAGEFTRRAFLNGKMDLVQVEAVTDVIASTSEAQHRISLNQLRGGYSSELKKIRAKLLELTSLMELELDFSEEDVEFADRERLSTLLDEATERCRSLAESFRSGNAIRNGIPVAILGAPNSGKSTLLNALLQEQRAIVSDIPGTTRDTVEELCVLGGMTFRFIDTAGIRESEDVVENLGIERSVQKAGEAQIVLCVIDITTLFDKETVLAHLQIDMLQQVEELLNISTGDPSKKIVILLNKSDLLLIDESRAGQDESSDNAQNSTQGNSIERSKTIDKALIEQSITELAESKGIHPHTLWISAKEGEGIDKLKYLLTSLIGKIPTDGVIISNARHAQALKNAAEALETVKNGLQSLPTDLLAEDLRSALMHIGSITGEFTTDEILGEIFSRFCIGK